MGSLHHFLSHLTSKARGLFLDELDSLYKELDVIEQFQFMSIKNRIEKYEVLLSRMPHVYQQIILDSITAYDSFNEGCICVERICDYEILTQTWGNVSFPFITRLHRSIVSRLPDSFACNGGKYEISIRMHGQLVMLLCRNCIDDKSMLERWLLILRKLVQNEELMLYIRYEDEFLQPIRLKSSPTPIMISDLIRNKEVIAELDGLSELVI